ncbi:hypothetical protein J5N97_019091 [Dioscorea zingiberensis]|uniref:Uncharacterized protein n=1 Tax=Dioscorea zingiberensis TaxID=325984 RepID=A0A9D5HCD6_9LILI|nr:hypothetical protein J5N97_019091 [Dioscorea zingiberensis]
MLVLSCDNSHLWAGFCLKVGHPDVSFVLSENSQMLVEQPEEYLEMKRSKLVISFLTNQSGENLSLPIGPKSQIMGRLGRTSLLMDKYRI